ncbi:hypothetical protein [Streptomyces sp. NPDC006610]
MCRRYASRRPDADSVRVAAALKALHVSSKAGSPAVVDALAHAL